MKSNDLKIKESKLIEIELTSTFEPLNGLLQFKLWFCPQRYHARSPIILDQHDQGRDLVLAYFQYFFKINTQLIDEFPFS
jgi:hypothetical protein